MLLTLPFPMLVLVLHSWVHGWQGQQVCCACRVFVGSTAYHKVSNSKGFPTAWNGGNDMPGPLLPSLPKQSLEASFKGRFQKLLVHNKRWARAKLSHDLLPNFVLAQERFRPPVDHLQARLAAGTQRFFGEKTETASAPA